MSATERSYHHGDLRSALLRRTVEVIADEGTDAVSLRGLARDLGVSHAAPARHFASRDELLRAVVLEGAQAMVARARGAVARAEDDAIAHLQAMGQSYLDWALANPAHYRAMRNPEVRRGRDELQGVIAQFATMIRGAIVRAQADGWHADGDPKVEMFRFISSIMGAAILLTDPIYAAIEGKGEDGGRALYDDLLERLLA